MHRLKTIEIHGFRGQVSPIKLALKPDANFLIGRNGTGKTTLINLLHAALSVDIGVLREGAFDRIEFWFKEPKSRRNPKVTVTRRSTEEAGSEIIYRVQDSVTDAAEEYSFSRMRRVIVSHDGSRRSVMASTSRIPIKDRLNKIYRTTWLSLQRGADAFETDEPEFNEDGGTDVDRKLEQVLNELVKYFSRLDRQVSDQTQIFQKHWFLSFLATERHFKPALISNIDMTVDRSALTDIFDKFNMAPDTYESQLDKHFKLAGKISASVKKGGDISFRDFLVVYDVIRLHSLVEQWQELQGKQKAIYNPKTEFIKIASEMLFRKNIIVNSSNQVVVRVGDESQNSNPVPIRKLSSGEKQLMIFLSETLLQEQAPYIFLADEPELSLHVEWQEELVPNLLKINPNAQVLFATHSPDIVNVYQKNVFKMEELID